MDSAHTCEVCREKDKDPDPGARASCYCEQCHLHLCHRCVSTHQKDPDLSRHPLHGLHIDQAAKKPAWPQKPNCSIHAGKPLEVYCTGHRELLCQKCARSGHGKCHIKKTLPDAAQHARTELKQRAQRMRDRGSDMTVQSDHITNELRAMKVQLEDAFRDLHKALDERQENLTRQFETQENTALKSLAETEHDREIINLTASSVTKVAETAPDDALVVMTKSLTSRLDDVEKRADVTSNIRPGRLSFEESTLIELKSVIGSLGQFRQEEEEQNSKPPTTGLKHRTSVRVRVPGAPGSCAWVQAPDQSERATGKKLAKILRTGHRVKRSSQWKSGNKDGGTEGTVRHVGTKSVLLGLVEVTWDSGHASWHCMGRDNTYELELASDTVETY